MSLNLDESQVQLGFLFAVLRAAIGGSPAGVVVLYEGRVWARNGVALDLLGSNLEPTRPEDWPETYRLYDPATRTLYDPQKFLLTRLSRESLVQDAYHELPEGSRQRLRFTARPVRTKAVDGAVVFIEKTGSGW